MQKLASVLLLIAIVGFLSGCGSKSGLTSGSGMMAGDAVSPTRIVVLPFYVEQGVDVAEGGRAASHYRRSMRFINNQFVRHNFEVINPFAHDAAEEEYRRLMEIAEEDSLKASTNVCLKYGADAAYISRLQVKTRLTDDGYCKASARFDGEGYDSAGHDLGIGVSKTFHVTSRDCDDAVAEVEKEIGDLVGRKLTAWSGGQKQWADDTKVADTGGGVLYRNSAQNSQFVTVRLDGATEYELVEVFGKVVKTARGVLMARNYGQRIVPDNPQASFVTWRATVDGDTDGFVLQANIIKMLNDVSDSGGTVMMKGVPYRYTAAEVDLLKGIRPADATSLSIQFLLDRELARDREMAGRHDPYLHRSQTRSKTQNFE